MTSKTSNKPVLRRRTNLFNRRIVISLPPWGVGVGTAAIGLAIFDRFTVVTNAVALCVTLLSVIFCFTARRMVRGMRFEVHHILNDIGNEEVEDAPEDGKAPVFQMNSRKGKSA